MLRVQAASVKKAPPTIPTAAAAGKEVDFATLRPFQLKSQLKTRNLPVDGTTEEMVERLQVSTASSDSRFCRFRQLSVACLQAHERGRQV